MLGTEARRKVSRAVSKALSALRTCLPALSLVAASVSLAAEPPSGAGEKEAFEARHQRMLAETDRLLEEVEESVFETVEQRERELAEAEEAIETAFASEVGRAPRPEDLEAERRRLKAEVEEWRTLDFYSTKLLTHSSEINDVRRRAMAIAEANGLNVDKLERLYSLGLEVIRTADFESTDRPPPSRALEGPEGYFAKLFLWAVGEDLEADEIARKIDYKRGLYLRMSFTFLDALLASGEEQPPCALAGTTPARREIDGQEIPRLGCPDPVVERLRGYVDAVRQMQSADADAFLAHAEMVVAEQQAGADLMAALPLIGEAIDLYGVIWGENLAGQCLSRFERGLTSVLVAVPVFGPQLVRFLAARSETAVMALLKTRQFVDATVAIGERLGRNLSEIGSAVSGPARTRLEGVARYFGLSMPDLTRLREILATEIEITETPWVTQQTLSEAELARLRDLETTFETLQDAKANRLRVRDMPPEFRQRALAEAAERMGRNAANGAMESSRQAVVAGSNMVPSHVEALVEVAARRDEVLVFRAVNPDATRLIEAHFATKGMRVKGKSADWGPHAGMIPVEQKFSKLGNPRRGLDPARIDAGDAREIAEFHGKVAECLSSGPCKKMEAVTGDGQKILVVPDPGAGREMPVVFDGERYLDPDTGSPLDLTPEQLEKRKPMEVLAVEGDDGALKPLTADYDFLAVGDTGDVAAPQWHDTQGAVTPQIQETIADVNDSIRNRARHRNGLSYQGGDIVHHGPETWYPGSPGALKNDPEITVLDPQQGPILIRRCDAECMQQWCDANRLCGGLQVCGETPVPPCIPVDPDRILKDYFHAKRLDGYNLSPNAAWGWGDYNGLGGWTVDGFLRAETFQRWTRDSVGLGDAARRAIWLGKRVQDGVSGAVEYAFECSEEGN